MDESWVTETSPWISYDLSNWETLTKNKKPVLYKKKSFLFHQNDPAAFTYIVKSGRVRISSFNIEGIEKQLYIAENGCCIGEISCIMENPHTYSAIAIVETVVLLTRKRKSKDYKVEIEIPIDVDGSKTYTEEKSTYQNIKKFIKAKYGVNTHTKDIAEVKRDCGVEMRLNYNISKKENPKIRHCTQEKRGYIMDALEHYQVI